MVAGLGSLAIEAEGPSAVDIGREAPSQRLHGGLREDRQSLISVNDCIMGQCQARRLQGK